MSLKMIFVSLVVLAFAGQAYGCTNYTQFLAESDECGTTYNQTIRPLWAQLAVDEDLETFCNSAGDAAFTLEECGNTAFENDGACNETVEGQLADHLNLSTADFRETCADFCLVNHTAAATDIETCVDTLNSTMDSLVHNFTASSDFDAECNSIDLTVDAARTCLGLAVNGHACPDVVNANLAFVLLSSQFIFNMTCDNDDFDLSVLTGCDNISETYGGVVDCINPLFFVDGIGIGDGELTCLQGATVVQTSITCLSEVTSLYSCSEEASTALDSLVPDRLGDFTEQCGDYTGYFTTTPENGGQASIMYSSVTLAVAATTRFLISGTLY